MDRVRTEYGQSTDRVKIFILSISFPYKYWFIYFLDRVDMVYSIIINRERKKNNNKKKNEFILYNNRKYPVHPVRSLKVQ